MKYHGFTIIELIAVIAILAVIAAVAVPRLADLTDEAEHASVAQQAGSFATSVQFAHMKWQLIGNGSFQDDLPGFGDGTVDVNAAGYPIDGTSQGNSGGANNNNIPNNNNGDLRCRRVFEALLSSAGSVCGGAGGQGVPCTDHDFQAARNGANTCRYTYRDDPARFFDYTVLDGQVGLTNP